jgi:hypothetical protein
VLGRHHLLVIDRYLLLLLGFRLERRPKLGREPTLLEVRGEISAVVRIQRHDL